MSLKKPGRIRILRKPEYRTCQGGIINFWDVVGRNTDYAEDPEEIMASNFALSISRLDDGYAKYSDPGIPEGIVDYLKTGSAEIF